MSVTDEDDAAQSVQLPDRPPPDDPPVHGNRRIARAEILTVSARLFSTRGYRATNLGEVAKELNVTRQALYYYFKKKDDILVALFTEVFDELERAVGNLQESTPGARLREMLRAHLRVVSMYPAHVNVVQTEQAALASETRHDMSARRWAYQQRFMAAFEEAVAAGECVDVPSDFAVSVLLSAANMTSRWLNRVGVLDPDYFAEMTEQFLAGGYLLSDSSDRPS